MPLLVLVTVPKKTAKPLAKMILETKLCACVNIVAEIDSCFWWQEKIDAERESLLLIKTKSSLFSKLEKQIKANHPYKVPEIIGFEIDKINKEYNEWLNKETRG